MRVLVACEFSGVVRGAFRKRGHDAWSCDLLPSESWGEVVFASDLPPCPYCGEEPWCPLHESHYADCICIGPTEDGVAYKEEGGRMLGARHYKGDVLGILNDGWDMLIAFPPCTHLASSGARWFKDKQEEQAEAIAFVQALMDAPIPRIAIENPVGVISSQIRKPDQIIQPFHFGDPFRKKTCLWLRGLPPLFATSIVAPKLVSYNRKDGSGIVTFSADYGFGTKGAGKRRSTTYQGIADAMAEQWG